MHTMTTKQTIARLKPLRADVCKRHQRVLDKLATGASASDCQGPFNEWRQAVRRYLDELAIVAVDTDQLPAMIAELSERLDTGFDMEYPGSAVDSWKLDKHFAKLLSELEVVSDIYAGHTATRFWLRGQDARLRQTIRRSTREQPPVAVDGELMEVTG
jgi:hypothetical protein